jgi:cyclopropane-fatty-acyl-phospholipid synthase
MALIEAYLDGAWDTPDLPALMDLLALAAPVLRAPARIGPAVRPRRARRARRPRRDRPLRDWRDEKGVYAGLLSVEMVEAVGERHWPAFFAALRDRLRPGGRLGLQAITIPDDRLPAYRRRVDFVQKHVFPGGFLPSPGALCARLGRAGLSLEGVHAFGDSYERTLRLWLGAFDARWPEIAALGFDQRFRRLWRLYLASCAAALREHNCGMLQITASRPG